MSGTEEEKDAREDDDQPSRQPMSMAKRSALLIGGAALCIALVACLGYWQFGRRADGPIELVKSLPLSGTDVTIGEGILDFIKDSGVEIVSVGFRPTWGAEQVGRDEWIVNFIFEEGRESRWASWTVNTRSGRVTPRNDLARKIQSVSKGS